MFAEIADSFMQFMGDGIFVAHSVNFDFGFIAYEYERLERRFPFSEALHLRGNAAALSRPSILQPCVIFARPTA